MIRTYKLKHWCIFLFVMVNENVDRKQMCPSQVTSQLSKKSLQLNQAGAVCWCRTSHLCLLPVWAEWGKWNQQAGMWAVCNQVSPPFPIDCWVKIIQACWSVCPPSCLSLSFALSLNFSSSDSLSGVQHCCFALNVTVDEYNYLLASIGGWLRYNSMY